jgi:hypothetical protein
MKGKAMSVDLVERLRRKALDNRETSPATMHEAADRIEALQAALADAEAERDGLAKSLLGKFDEMERLIGDSDKLLAERDGAYALAEKVARDYASKAKLRGWTTAPESAAMAAQHIAQNIRQLKGQHHD